LQSKFPAAQGVALNAAIRNRRTVILIDDGLATGSTMRAAAIALRNMQPSKIIVAVPVAAAETCADFCSEVDEVTCEATLSRLWLWAGGIRILSRPATRKFVSCWTESPLIRRTLHSIRDQKTRKALYLRAMMLLAC